MKKILLFMHFFLCITSIYSQEQKITLNINSLSQKESIQLIEKQTNFKFYYIEDWLSTTKKTKNFVNAEIDDVLNFIFENTNLNYYIFEENKIILSNGNLIKESIYNNNNNASLKATPTTIVNTTILNKNKKINKVGKENNKSKLKKSSVSGYVKSAKNNLPLEGVIVLERTKNISVTTNEKGFFSINLPYGNNKIEALLVGFSNSSKQLIVYNDGSINFFLTENSEQLNEIVIDANKKNNVKKVIAGVTKLDVREIKNIPLVLGERDLLKVATTLPGIKSAGEGAEGINVRGGKIDQNLFLLDNSVIYNPTHFLGLFSAVNPFTSNEVTIYKGNIPAEYGGRISSVFDMKTKDADTEEFKGEASIGPVTGNISLETPIVKGKSGLLVGIRSTYSDWILNTLKDKSLKKSSIAFSDVIAKYNHKLNDKNAIKLTGYYSYDKYQIASDTTNYYGNKLISLDWNHKFNDKNNGHLIISNSNYNFNSKYEADGNSNFNLKYQINETNLELKNTYTYSKEHNFGFGVASKLYKVSPGAITPKGSDSSVNPFSIPKEKGLENALFISDDYTVNKKLAFNLGLRYSMFLGMGESEQRIYQKDQPKNTSTLIRTEKYDDFDAYKTYQGLSYRLAGRYLINSSLSVKASYNKTFQYIHRLSNNTTASPIDTWRLSDKNIKPQQGTQLSLGLFKNLNDDELEISLETYYKKYTNLIDYKVGASLLLNKTIETEVLQGPGKSYGIEFLIKKKKGRLNGWFGYSYSRSLIKLDSYFAEERVNNGMYFSTNYDKPHDLNIVANYKLTKRFSFSSNFTFQSGRPITYPTGKYSYEGEDYLIYSDRNKFRIPNYYRLDLGFNVEGNHKKKKFAHSFWNISVYNVLGRNNPYSVFFETKNGKVVAYKSSIFSIPIPTITYNFKF